MDKVKLSHATARDAQPGTELWDREVTGLYLRSLATTKTWTYYYRTRAGKERRKKIGRYPDMTLMTARKLAREIAEKVARGEDPSAEWQASRDAPTINELCDAYIKHWSAMRHEGSTQRAELGYINSQIRPGLGNLQVTELTSVKVDRFLERVYRRGFTGANDGRGETAHWSARNTKKILARMLHKLPKLFGITLPHNPMEDTLVYGQIKRKRHATMDEMRRIDKALALLSTKGEEGKRRAACLWTMFLTGGRVAEIRNLKGSQLATIQGRIWIIYDKHKTVKHTGTKNVALPAEAERLLNDLPPLQGHEPVFGPLTKCALEKVWARVRSEAGVEGLRMMDARRTFASYALTQGISLDLVGELLGHLDPKTTSGYAYLIDEKKHQAANTAADAIMRAARED